MTPSDKKELDNWFSYHPPTTEKLVAYDKIRNDSRAIAEYVVANVPESADRAAALRSLRNTVMAINLAIACHGE